MIKSVGRVAINPTHRLSCHCGAVILELELPDGIVNPVVAIALSAVGKARSSLRSLGLESMSFKVYTHHQRRSYPDRYSMELIIRQIATPDKALDGCSLVRFFLACGVSAETVRLQGNAQNH